MIELNTFEKAVEMSKTMLVTDEMRQTAQICQSFKGRPSEYAGISDEIEALAYDLACSRILEEQKKKNAFEDAKQFGAAIGKSVREQIFGDLRNCGELYLEIKKIVEENQ